MHGILFLATPCSVELLSDSRSRYTAVQCRLAEIYRGDSRSPGKDCKRTIQVSEPRVQWVSHYRDDSLSNTMF
jgi:hypothetical protein